MPSQHHGVEGRRWQRHRIARVSGTAHGYPTLLGFGPYYVAAPLVDWQRSWSVSLSVPPSGVVSLLMYPESCWGPAGLKEVAGKHFIEKAGIESSSEPHDGSIAKGLREARTELTEPIA